MSSQNEFELSFDYCIEYICNLQVFNLNLQEKVERTSIIHQIWS